MALRAVGASGNLAPEPAVVECAEEILRRAKAGEIVGLFGTMEMHASREVFMAGDLDVDGIAGFHARVLAAVANGA